MAYTLRLYTRELERVGEDPRILAREMELADELVVDSSGRAPKRTGEGAASIHAESEVVDGSWVVHVSWDPEHHYMQFQEVGTPTIRPHEFMRAALIARGGTPLR